jgi:hypothetical protein
MSNMVVSDSLASARQWVLHSERVFSVSEECAQGKPRVNSDGMKVAS